MTNLARTIVLSWDDQRKEWMALVITSFKGENRRKFIDFLGGQSIGDEPLHETAIAEVWEEYGKRIDGKFYTIRIEGRGEHCFGMYLLIVDKFDDPIPGSSEGVVQAVPLEELIRNKIPLSPDSKRMLKFFRTLGLAKARHQPAPRISKAGSLILRP